MRFSLLLLPIVVTIEVTWATRGTTCPCGLTNKQGRILGGMDTKRHEFPWMAALYDTSRSRLRCGASIITRHHAVTAGHCAAVNTSNLVLLVGTNNLKDSREGKKISVKKIIRHPNFYKRGVLSDDIAVVVTRNSIAFSQTIGPVCLPKRKINLVNQKIKAIGWGREGNRRPYSPYLKSVDLTVTSYEACRRYWKLIYPPSQTCTLDVGKSTCYGDSGGPLVWIDPETSRYTLVALTSFGKACTLPPPTVNTEIAVYLPWIKEIVADKKSSIY